MPKSRNIHLWRCDLLLHDYLRFATTRRGHIEETGQFIHNYSLTYALGWVGSEWYSSEQKPQYAQHLNKVKDMYATPASLLIGDYVLTSHRTETECYTSSGLGDVSYSVVKCFGPGSVFRFYILARLDMDRIPSFVRLGKSMAKAEITKQYPVELEITEGDCVVSSLLNWNDMGAKPSLCDVIVYALPGRLIENARFAGIPYLRAEFAGGEEVKLPLQMGYFQKQLCSSWWREHRA